MAKNNVPIVSNPVMVDKVIGQLQTGLKANLAWLDNAFGKAQKITKKIGQKTYIFPACFAGDEEYLDVSPDSNIGNFSFIQLHEPQNLEWIPNQLGSLSVPFSVIFWFDIRKVFPNNYKERNTEAIKAEILNVLNLHIKLRDGRFSFNKIYETAQNIYREYPGVMEIENQFMMHPFGGIRIEGVLTINQPC